MILIRKIHKPSKMVTLHEMIVVIYRKLLYEVAIRHDHVSISVMHNFQNVKELFKCWVWHKNLLLKCVSIGSCLSTFLSSHIS